MDFLGNGNPMDWPNSLGKVVSDGAGSGPPSSPPTVGDAKNVMAAWDAIKDHDAITSADFNRVEAALRDQQYGFAYQLIDGLRRKIVLSGRPKKVKADLWQQLTKSMPSLPPGWGFKDEAINGVPNWTLYSVAGLLTLLLVVKKRK